MYPSCNCSKSDCFFTLNPILSSFCTSFLVCPKFLLVSATDGIYSLLRSFYSNEAVQWSRQNCSGTQEIWVLFLACCWPAWWPRQSTFPATASLSGRDWYFFCNVFCGLSIKTTLITARCCWETVSLPAEYNPLLSCCSSIYRIPNENQTPTADTAPVGN